MVVCVPHGMRINKRCIAHVPCHGAWDGTRRRGTGTNKGARQIDFFFAQIAQLTSFLSFAGFDRLLFGTETCFLRGIGQ